MKMVFQRRSNFFYIVNILISTALSWNPPVYHYPPRLLIFDLDTLVWPFWLKDTKLEPPLKLIDDGEVIDAVGVRVKAYDDVPEILCALNRTGQKLAVVGRMGHEVLDIFNWTNYFSYVELYPGSKICHIVRLSLKTKYDYSDLLFFGKQKQETEFVEQTTETFVFQVGKRIEKKRIELGLMYFSVKKAADST